MLDVRITIETADGALIDTRYAGLTDLGPGGYQRFLDGAFPADQPLDLRTRLHCRTMHPDYAWLNRAFLVSVGKAYLDRGEVCYDVHELG